MTFTRPYFGTASSRSKTFAVSRYSGAQQQLVDRLAAGLEVALELRAAAADVVRALQRLHPLHERSLGRSDGLGGRFADRRHGRRLYILGRGDQGQIAAIRLDLKLRSSIVEDGCGNTPMFAGGFTCSLHERERRQVTPVVTAVTALDAYRAEGAASSAAIAQPGRRIAEALGADRDESLRRRASDRSASRPVWTPPIPTIGIDGRRRHRRGPARARPRGRPDPRRRRCPPPSHGAPVPGSSAIPRIVLISETASAPASCGRARDGRRRRWRSGSA